MNNVGYAQNNAQVFYKGCLLKADQISYIHSLKSGYVSCIYNLLKKELFVRTKVFKSENHFYINNDDHYRNNEFICPTPFIL